MNNQVIIEQLGNILNALGMIETSGKNTLVMADCVRALDEVIQIMNQNLEAEKTAEKPADNAADMQEIIDQIGE